MMAKRKLGIIARKQRGVLVGATQYDQELLDALPDGTDFDVETRKRRSLKQLGTYRAILDGVVASTDRWATSNHLHRALRIELGYTRIDYDMKGRPVITLDSTSFDNMTQDEFNIYFEKSMATLASEIGFDPMLVLERKAA